MPSSTEIANYGLTHLGITDTIANIDTDKDVEGQVMRRIYATAIEGFLRDFNYSTTTQRVVLGLVQENPNDEYQYEYTYPADALSLNRLVSGAITDTAQSDVHYRIVRGSSSRLIWTNSKDAEIEYTFLETDDSRFPADMVWAISYLLAMLAAPALTAGDPTNLQGRAEVKYEAAKSLARSNSEHDDHEEEQPQSEFITARQRETFNNRAGKWEPYPGSWDII